MLQNQPIGRRIAIVVVGLVALTVIAFGMATTFTFGYSVIGAFMLQAIVGSTDAALLSGLMTLVLFDGGWIAGLVAFVWAADTFWQRALAGVQMAVNLLFSLLASIVSIIILSPFAAYVSPATVNTARYIGVTALLVALALNIVATIVQILTAPRIADSLRSAMQTAAEPDFQQRMEDRLDNESRKQAETLIEREIPSLAQERSRAALLDYYARMGFTHGRVIEHDPHEQVPTARPKMAQSADRWTLAALLEHWGGLTAHDFMDMAAHHNWYTTRAAWNGLADLPASNPYALPAGLSYDQFAAIIPPALPEPAPATPARFRSGVNGTHADNHAG